MSKQMKPKERRAQIIDEALRQAASVGYQNIERAKIAAALDVSPALISARTGTMPELKTAVLREAICRSKSTDFQLGRHTSLRVIAQALGVKDRRALRLPPELKAAALSSLNN